MGKKGIETLVGLFVLMGMLGLVFLALKAANLASFGGGDTYTLTAKFDNIGGLKPRAPVRSAGVNVGRVASISSCSEASSRRSSSSSVAPTRRPSKALKTGRWRSARGASRRSRVVTDMAELPQAGAGSLTPG